MYPQANPVWNAFLPSPRLNAYEVFDSGHVAVTVCIYLVRMMFFVFWTTALAYKGIDYEYRAINLVKDGGEQVLHIAFSQLCNLF